MHWYVRCVGLKCLTLAGSIAVASPLNKSLNPVAVIGPNRQNELPFSLLVPHTDFIAWHCIVVVIVIIVHFLFICSSTVSYVGRLAIACNDTASIKSKNKTVSLKQTSGWVHGGW